jgi:hypothetical protein
VQRAAFSTKERIMFYLKRFAIAAAALGLTATAALARPAVSETDLNVRSGPGTGYRVVGVLERGETVDVGPCSGSWCRVSFSGGSGWASASYLAFAGGAGGYAAPPAVVYDEPYYDPYFADDYYDGPSFGFGVVVPGYRHRYHRGHHAGRGGRRGGGAAVVPRGGQGNFGMRSGGFRGNAGASFRGGGGSSFRGGGGSSFRGGGGGGSRGGGGGGGGHRGR